MPRDLSYVRNARDQRLHGMPQGGRLLDCPMFSSRSRTIVRTTTISKVIHASGTLDRCTVRALATAPRR